VERPAISSRQERTILLTIVLADDSAEYREIVRYLLAAASDMRIVGEAADGEEALALAHRVRPDLVVTDLTMPRLNGIELTRHIRQELPRTMVILMSSHTEDAYRLMASDSGADVFVSKRVVLDALLPAIRDLAARRVLPEKVVIEPGRDRLRGHHARHHGRTVRARRIGAARWRRRGVEVSATGGRLERRFVSARGKWLRRVLRH